MSCSKPLLGHTGGETSPTVPSVPTLQGRDPGDRGMAGRAPRECHRGGHLREVLGEGDAAPGGQPDAVGVTGGQAAPARGDTDGRVPELPSHVPVPSHVSMPSCRHARPVPVCALAHPRALAHSTPLHTPVSSHALARPCTLTHLHALVPPCPPRAHLCPCTSSCPCTLHVLVHSTPLHTPVPSHAPAHLRQAPWWAQRLRGSRTRHPAKAT